MILSGTISTQQSTIDCQVGGAPNALSFIAPLQPSRGILSAFDSSLSPAYNGLKIPQDGRWQQRLLWL